MPLNRTLLLQTPLLKVERVVLHAPCVQWSPSYEVASPRLVLPFSGATEFRMAGQSVLLDSLTAMSLPTGLLYEMKPCPEAARASIVVSPQPAADHLIPPSQAWALSPRAIWLLRRHWRAIALGKGVGSTQALLQTVLNNAPPVARIQGRSASAVQRAQRFMVARTATMTPWTLNDVADAACCSLFHLARAFRKHTGLSLHGYRQRLRLASALQRLEEGERDLAALAHELGYSSQSHLGAAFVRELGVTPAHPRRELGA